MDRLSLNALLRERVRKYLYTRAEADVLVLGDSHVRVFEHWWFLKALPRTRFEIVYVPGATAGGVGNAKSVTGAFKKFQAALEKKPYDLVLVQLGEVDTAYTLWKRAEVQKKDVADLMEQSVTRYCAFLQHLQSSKALAVLSASLPTLADHAQSPEDVRAVRAQVGASQAERTALALAFNGKVADFCVRNGIPYLNSDEAALGQDGLVRAKWTNQGGYDHHYARAPYARWLAASLRELAHPRGVRLR